MESGVQGFHETSGVLDFLLCRVGLSPTRTAACREDGLRKAVTCPGAWG